MSRRARHLSILAVVAACLVAQPPVASSTATPVERAGDGKALRVLVFSRTTRFRHGSIPFGILSLRNLGREHGFAVHTTEDPRRFNERNLRRYGAVIFLNTTGNVLNVDQQLAFERYVRSGGGYVGIHSAADTEYDWPFYGRLLAGAWFNNHPIQQLATFVNEAPDQPAAAHLPRRFAVFDEFYSFVRNPRPRGRVLLTIDESTYMPDPNTDDLPGGTPSTGYMGDHPMSWCRDIGHGRSFYTNIGHEIHPYFLPWYRRHVLGGILTAARRVDADCTPRPL